METCSRWNKLLNNLNYIHHILPYYGWLDQGANLMIHLCKTTKLTFEENIVSLVTFSFSKDSQRRSLKVNDQFNEKTSEFIQKTNAGLYFILTISAWYTPSMTLLKSFLEQWSNLGLWRFKQIDFYVNNTNYEIYNEIILHLKSNKISLECIKVGTNSTNFQEGQTLEYSNYPLVYSNEISFVKEFGEWSLWTLTQNLYSKIKENCKTIITNNFDISLIKEVEEIEEEPIILK